MSQFKGFPHRQPFNVSPIRNKTKVKAWWQLGKSNNRTPKKKREEE